MLLFQSVDAGIKLQAEVNLSFKDSTDWSDKFNGAEMVHSALGCPQKRTILYLNQEGRKLYRKLVSFDIY